MKRDLLRSVFYLRVISDRKVYRVLGFTSIYDYAAQTAGLSNGQCKAFIRLGGRLENLPQMQRALSEGTITWRKANIIIEKASPINEQGLIQIASEMGEKELRAHCAGAAGSHSPKPRTKRPAVQPPLQLRPQLARKGQEVIGKADAVQHVLFKFTPEQYAVWLAFTVRQEGPTKEEQLLSAFEAGGSSKKNARSHEPGFLITIQHCPACERAVHQTPRGTFEVPVPLLEMAKCDGLIEDSTARRKRSIPPRVRRSVLKRDHYHCQAEGCHNTNHLQLHHRLPVAQGGASTLENLVTLCRRCHRRLHEEEEALRVANRGPIRD